MGIFSGFLVEDYPEAHPDEAESTDDDEGHFPSVAPADALEEFGERADGEGCDESADSRSCIEDGCGVGTVTLGEVFGSHLDGCGEVSGLTESEDGAGGEEEVDRYGSNCHCNVAGGFDESGSVVDAERGFSSHTADRMETCAGRPYADCPEVAFLGAHPVDEAAGKKVGHGIDDGEDGCDQTIVGVGPVELGRNELFPSERKHLTVHVVDCGREEKQRADGPAEVGHLFVCCCKGGGCC